MKIAEYKQIDVEVKKDIIHHEAEYDEEGNLIVEAYDEEVIKEVPKMGLVYRDMTEEEEAEMLRQQKEFEEIERSRPLTAEERMDILEDAFAEFVSEVLADD